MNHAKSSHQPHSKILAGKMMIPVLFTLILTAHALPEFDFDFEFKPNPIRLHSDGVGIVQFDCSSWRWAVETDNAQNWPVVPAVCVPYVAHYMAGIRPGFKPSQYLEDINMLAMYAGQHINQLNPSSDGKDVWIFDLDETLLSDLAYYSRPDVNFGGFPFNKTKFYEWVATGELPAIEPIVKLYKKVLSLGIKVVIISGTYEEYREARIKNLKRAGVHTYEKLILRKKSERGIPALKYKSDKRTELVNEGYTIVGNIGDQWSDLRGPNPGKRTFKVPNPMYYVD